ncbi:MAG TPA: hypothetical protein VFK90_06775, partial [Anaeromyxobacter sp.]|nr:hypothetical protein [Anaeromyxobacter sp.]
MLGSRDLALRYDDIFRLALPVLEASAARLGASGHALAFFDSGGWMLWLGGDPDIAARLTRLDFRPGTRWLADAAADAQLPAAPAERPPLELVVSNRGAPTAPWRCASAPVLAQPAGAWLGSLHVTSRGDAEALAAAGPVADAIEERVRAARSVREHVVEFALRGAAPSDAILAVDASGRLLAATPEARRRLALDAEVPERAREELRDALERAPATDHPELELDWPGVARVRLAVSPVRCEGRAVGGIVRVPVQRAAARPAPPPGAPVPAADGAHGGARYAFDGILGESEAIRAAVAL